MAIYNAVDRILNIKVNSLITVLILSLKVPTLAEVHVSLTIEGQPVNGIGIDHDVLYALQSICRSTC